MFYTNIDMPVKKYMSITFLIMLIIWHTACTKHAVGISGPVGPTGPAGSNGESISPSAITGFIDLYNEYGYPDTSNIGVTLSTLKGDTLETAITDTIGHFSLGPLPPGNYDILIKKPGYDSFKVFAQHSAGNEPQFLDAIRMDASLTTKILSETVSIQQDVFGDKLFVANLSFNGPPSTYQTATNFNFYFSRSKELSTQNYDVMAPGDNEVTLTNNYEFQYDLTNITETGVNYAAGDTIYVKTYVSPVPNSISSWFNYATYQTVSYPYLGDSVENYFLWP